MESKRELKETFPDSKYATGLVIVELKDRLKICDTHWHTNITDEKRREYAIEKNLILFLAGLFGVEKQVNSDAPCTDDGNPLSASSDSKGT
jgi:hypothetical protein